MDDRETAVVIAHEQAHARFRHDRYLLLAQLAAATSPLLGPVSSRLRYSLERWADENAVEQCGDRTLVARTLAKVALVAPAPTGALAAVSACPPASRRFSPRAPSARRGPVKCCSRRRSQPPWC